MQKTDDNGDKVSEYLRQVEGEPEYVRCVADNHRLRISTRGWSQIHDHAGSAGHKFAMTLKKGQKSVGFYSERHLANRIALNTFHMRLLLFCNEHGVALENFDCLVKCVKSSCPDSQIAQSAKAITRKTVTNKLRYGLAKTELDQTLEDIRNTEFSAVLDAGTKGNQKRTEFVVRYWSKTEKKVVEKFLKASTSNKETSAIVAKIFLDMMEKYQVPLKNLVNINCDSCSILRGKKSGAIKKIAAQAPQISECDIGGDGLHCVANAFKRAGEKTCPTVDNTLSNVKHKIRSSPAKVDAYKEAAVVVGDDPIMPASYCASHWLDRYQACNDVVQHLDTLEKYYKDAKLPDNLSSNSESEESNLD